MMHDFGLLNTQETNTYPGRDDKGRLERGEHAGNKHLPGETTRGLERGEHARNKYLSGETRLERGENPYNRRLPGKPQTLP